MGHVADGAWGAACRFYPSRAYGAGYTGYITQRKSIRKYLIKTSIGGMNQSHPGGRVYDALHLANSKGNTHRWVP